MTPGRLALSLGGISLVSVVALALWSGPVDAKPSAPATRPVKLTTGVTLEGVDPLFARQLSPRPLTANERTALKNADQVVDAPKFSIKKLDAVQRARILGADDTAILSDTRVFDAQNLVLDDTTWMSVGSSIMGATVRPQANVLSFQGPMDPSAPYRAAAVIHFVAEANTRYLLECGVTAGPGVTFTARGAAGEFSTTSDDRASLLLVHDADGRGPVNFELNASDVPWHLEGCELTSYRR